MGTMIIYGGLVILGATLLQAAIGLYSVTARTLSGNRLDRAQLDLFKEQASTLLKRVDAGRAKQELTWNGKRKFRIANRVYEDPSNDICSFYLIPHDNKPLPPFNPGQFLTFELPVPGQPQPVVRCYSLSDRPRDEPQYRVSIKKQGVHPKAPKGTPPGLSSNFFHDHLQVDEIVEVFAPAGEFYLDMDSDRPIVLIGGGVGLTPVISMLNHVVATGSNREVWFFYGVRHRQEHAMYEHIQEIVKENPNVHAVIAYSDPTDKCKLGVDYDFEGRVSVELMRSKLDFSNYEFYICGPPPMMASITEQLDEWGVPEEDVHFEAFGPASVKKADPADSKPKADAETFEVEFAKSNVKVQWAENMGTLLELAEANGVRAQSGCRAGNCGTCLTAVKQGDVDYVSKPGKKPESGSCLICISQPKGDLVLDI